MTYATLRKLLIIVSSVAALSGAPSIDAAYARGGGGFDRGGGGIAHMGTGCGGGHMVGDVEADHMGESGDIGGEFAGGHSGLAAETPVGALAGVHVHSAAGGLHHYHHSRWFRDDAWRPRCDYGTDTFITDPDCRLPY